MSKKILIVDDDSSDLDKMKSILCIEKYSVVGVSDSSAALDKLKKDKFDLILLDILMPGLSGYDLLRLMREKFNSQLELVFVSIVPKNEVDLTGSDGFIQKPFSSKSLLSEIKKSLK